MNPKNSPQYHPLTFLRTRPYARYMARRYKDTIGSSTLPDHTVLDDYMRQIMVSYNSALESIPREQRPEGAGFIHSEVATGLAFGMLYAFGTNIFAIDAALAESFRHTDLDQAPLSAIEFAYESFYVAFPPQKDLQLGEPGQSVDGAYVYIQKHQEMRVLHIDLTTRAQPDLQYGDYITQGDPVYRLTLDLHEDPDRPVIDALTAACALR